MMLSAPQRALLLFVSASGYTAWFSGVGNRSEAAGFQTVRASALTVDERPPLPPVAALIRRDPFATYPPVRTKAAGPPAVADAGAAGAPATVVDRAPDASGTVVVPDIDTHEAQPPAATLTLVLRATIVGPEPVAYVANGTAMDIVRVGDTLGDRRVTRIDLRGIVFADGTRLDLPDSYAATPRPEARPDRAGERISLAALRRLLLPPSAAPGAAGAANAPSATPAVAPAPEPSTTYPTPGPLPTVDMRGLPVGVNPTPDAANPTPYPYPYPYAPPAPH